MAATLAIRWPLDQNFMKAYGLSSINIQN